MDATPRFPRTPRRRRRRPIGLPPQAAASLLLLRGACGLLALVALATGALAAPPDRRERPVFVCDDAGTPVFSDRPCGPDLVRRAIRVEWPEAGRPATTQPAAPAASTRPRARPAPRAEPGDGREARCAALQGQLEQLDDRMRAGYSSREAARLWERRRDLKERLRRDRC